MTSVENIESVRVAVVGGGPAGLMAAEALAAGGASVDVFDAMPSVGRKFLMAGKGGMNLTHSEPADAFVARYGDRRANIAPLLARFDAAALREWVHGLGVDTFVGSSGRVFPTDMKAAPMLRAWLHRLRASGVRLHMRHRWLGWTDAGVGESRFATPDGERRVRHDALVLALGGASWPQLGSDGRAIGHLAARGVDVRPFLPSNCGFDVDWTPHFRERFAGEPLKSVAIGLERADGAADWRVGECLLTEHGIEGSLIYALSAQLRVRLTGSGDAGTRILLDLVPQLSAERVRAQVLHPRGARSLSSHLQSRLHLAGAKAGLLRECLTKDEFADLDTLAARIKALPVRVRRPRPIAEVISSAGGVAFESLDERSMITALPGVFCAGEMLDWEAPTGGYLLTACFASGLVAGEGALAWLGERG
ncbi:TIGR03862 family flavoprotein [Caballeronia sp. LZ062]|uniref:TIGR03862 family flavoprotein n=1 Tax=unclassified Caballeronia TaxID=2646786 RepID=UPI0028619211|nr:MULTISPECIES: TIGR03862 family flavoprotein [unclassified Caballeronia]MDR5855661.1 TIGR03862 family flavoprotein [Caballeronia sp. LZ050]MDR5872551.1 TIGR03862 family flavoprotein [Caballeronia sp. LZ062]